MDNAVFKKCPTCGTVWHARDEFLEDSSLILNGYKADFNSLEKGLFFFTHKYENCYSTMAMHAGLFLGIYGGVRYTESKLLHDECPRYCSDEKKLIRCSLPCKFAFVREVMQIILESRRKNTPCQRSSCPGLKHA